MPSSKYTTSSNIECQVPNIHILREVTKVYGEDKVLKTYKEDEKPKIYEEEGEVPTTAGEKDKVAKILKEENEETNIYEETNEFEEIFVPVFKVKREEATYTKGDVKLQRVTVTETNLESKNEGRSSKSKIPQLRRVFERVAQRDTKDKENKVPTPQIKPRGSLVPRLVTSIETLPTVKQEETNAGSNDSKQNNKIPNKSIRKEIIIKHVDADIIDDVNTNVNTNAGSNVNEKNNVTQNKSVDKDIIVKKIDVDIVDDVNAHVTIIAESNDNEKNYIPNKSVDREIIFKNIDTDIVDDVNTHVDTNAESIVNEKYDEIPNKFINKEIIFKNIDTDIVDDVDTHVDTNAGSNVNEKIEEVPNKSVNKEIIFKNIDTDIVDDVNTEKADIGDKTVETEAEFDKIYETIETKSEEMNLEKVMPVTVEDSEIVESNFERIVHDYDKNKIKPLDLGKIRTRIPFRKQKSLHDVIPKRTERRSSLKEFQCGSQDEIKHNNYTLKILKDDGIPGTKEIKLNKAKDFGQFELKNVDNKNTITHNESNFDTKLETNDLEEMQSMKDDSNNAVHMKRSISSRIAMFERQSSKDMTTRSQFLAKENAKVVDATVTLEKKNKHEVLQLQPKRQTIHKNNTGHVNKDTILYTFPKKQHSDLEIDRNERFPKPNTIQEENIKVVATVLKDRDMPLNYTEEVIPKDKDIKDIKVLENNKTENEVLCVDDKPIIENNIKTAESKIPVLKNTQVTDIQANDKPKNDKTLSKGNFKTISISKLRENFYIFENTQVRDSPYGLRGKSTAEINIEEKMKGKVKSMLYKIKSIENLTDEMKYEEKVVINDKEKPKRKSVSEKIALFEAKSEISRSKARPIPIAMDINITDFNEKSIINKSKLKEEPRSEDEESNKIIKELQNAKETFGKVDTSYVKLSNGVDMPVLILGTALLDPNIIYHTICGAIDMGYRGIDTAFIYGNEKAVGEAIAAKIRDGTVQRSDLFIISKLWSTFHRQDLVVEACRASLQALGLTYIDLYLVHSPMSFKEGADPFPRVANVLQYSTSNYLDAWFGMEDLVTSGLVRSIGVSNFNSLQLTRVVEKGRIKPVVNQVECHPYLSQSRLSEHCSSLNVNVLCYGVLGSKGTPADLKDHVTPVIEDPTVVALATRLGVTPAQLLIRYQIDREHTVVVKATRASHLWDNLKAMHFKLTQAEIDALNALNRNKRTYSFKGMGDTHKQYPFNIPY